MTDELDYKSTAENYAQQNVQLHAQVSNLHGQVSRETEVANTLRQNLRQLQTQLDAANHKIAQAQLRQQESDNIAAANHRLLQELDAASETIRLRDDRIAALEAALAGAREKLGEESRNVRV